MEDKVFLLQQIEFLEFQLNDAKAREVQSKSMYESMIKSLSSESQIPQNDEKIIQMQKDQRRQVQEIEEKCREKLKILENRVKELEKTANDGKAENSNEKMELNKKIGRLEGEIEKKAKVILEFISKVKDFEEEIERKDWKILEIQKGFEELREKYNEDLIKIQCEGNKKLEELKGVYDTEKQSLKNIINQLENTSKSGSPSDSLADLVSDLNASTEKISSMSKYLEKVLADCSQAIKSIPEVAQGQTKLLTTLPFKEKLDLTEKMLKFSESAQEHFLTIKKSLFSLKKIIQGKEEKEKYFKETVEKKNAEIESLQRTISIKSCEPTIGQNCKIIEELIGKDTEINRLKRIIGELKEGELKNKPPTYGIKHTRSKTMSNLNSPFKIASSAKISQLNLSVLSNIEPTEEVNIYTTASSDRLSEEKSEIFEKKINTLQTALLKLKNQRDRAKNISEKLLLELKQKKLDLALLQEHFAEQKFSLTSQLKSLSNSLFSFSNSLNLPKSLKQDLQKILSEIFI